MAVGRDLTNYSLIAPLALAGGDTGWTAVGSDCPLDWDRVHLWNKSQNQIENLYQIPVHINY